MGQRQHSRRMIHPTEYVWREMTRERHWGSLEEGSGYTEEVHDVEIMCIINSIVNHKILRKQEKIKWERSWTANSTSCLKTYNLQRVVSGVRGWVEMKRVLHMKCIFLWGSPGLVLSPGGCLWPIDCSALVPASHDLLQAKGKTGIRT